MLFLIAAGALFSQATPLSSWTPVDDPLAPARQDLLLCSNPDHDAKTCNSIIRFVFQDGGSITGQSWNGVESYLPVSFKIKSKVENRNLEFCFHVTAKDIDDAAFLIGDKPAAPGDIDLLKKDVRTMLVDDIAGKQLCHRHFMDGDKLMVRMFVDGVEDIDAASTRAWVDQAAGYALLPADQIYKD
jgi:hypothetical protein